MATYRRGSSTNERLRRRDRRIFRPPELVARVGTRGRRRRRRGDAALGGSSGPRRPHPAASNARPKTSANAAARLTDGERATAITDRLRRMVRTIAETPADARGKSAAARRFRYERQRRSAIASAAAAPRRRAGALQPRHGVVEGAEEIGAVARAEGLGARGRLSCLAQMVHQVARRQRHADRVRGKALAGRGEDVGAGFDAAARQRNVRRDDDRARAGPFGDPVVRRVRPGRDDDPFDIRRARDQDRAVGDDEHAIP